MIVRDDCWSVSGGCSLLLRGVGDRLDFRRGVFMTDDGQVLGGSNGGGLVVIT